MKLVFRSALTACVAAALLAVSSTPRLAQDEDDGLITRDYHVHGMIQNENPSAARINAIRDVLAPDRWLFRDNDDGRGLDNWSLRDSGEEARCWDGVDELLENILDATGAGANEVSFPSYRSFRVTTDAESHARIKFMVDALREVADARVNLAIYRLPEDSTAAATMTPDQLRAGIKGARVVGTSSAGLGDPMVIQHTAHRTYVAGYDVNLSTESKVYEPTVSTLSTGNEFNFGVLSMPDGSLWVHGWHVAMTGDGMRSVATSGGQVELPDVNYRYSPVSALISNGGGVVVDSGDAGRYLVVARCDRVVSDRMFKCDDGRTLRLLNVAGVLTAYGPSQRWIMTPNSSRMLGEQLLPQVFIEPIEDGPYNDAAIYMYEMLEGSYNNVDFFGPYLLTSVSEDDEEFDAILHRAIDDLRTPAATITLRVSAFEVKNDAAIPAGVMLGSPSELDIAELKALGGTPVFTRTAAARPGEASDIMDIRLVTHVRDYATSSATGVSAETPVIGTIVLGTQLRWVARETPDGQMRVEVRSGTTVGPAELEQVKQGDKWVIERSSSALTQMRMSHDLAPGQGAASISPAAGADGQLLVLVVERLK